MLKNSSLSESQRVPRARDETEKIEDFQMSDESQVLGACCEELVAQYADDELQPVLGLLVATFVTTAEPLDEGALCALLADRRVVTASAKGEDLVRRGLEAAVDLLTNLKFVENMALKVGASALMKVYRNVALVLEPSHPRRRTLELLGKAVRLDISLLTSHPQHLFQTLWNRCWWYDCPQAAEHYFPPEMGSSKIPPWARPDGEKLYKLMDRWREQKEASPDFVWLQSLRPPEYHLDSAFVARVQEFSSESFQAATFIDSRQLVLGSCEGVYLWNFDEDGATHQLYEGKTNAVVLSPDGKYLAIGGEEVFLWDISSGERTVTFGGCGTAYCLAFSPDGRYLAAGTVDTGSSDSASTYQVHLWNVATGVEVRVLCRGLRSMASMLAVS